MSIKEQKRGSQSKEKCFQSEGELLWTSILAAFSGFSEPGESEEIQTKEYRASEVTVYKAFEKLSKEYPDRFPGLYFSDLGGVPHSKDLEDNLSNLGAFGMLEHDYRHCEVSPESSKAIRDVLKEEYGEANLKSFISIAKRFRELVKGFEEA